MSQHKKKPIGPTASSMPDKIRNFILCLYYLNQEAKQDGLWVVADVLQQSITAIEKGATQRNNRCTVSKYIDHSVYYVLEFLDRFRTLSQDRQKALASLLEHKDLDKILEELESCTIQ